MPRKFGWSSGKPRRPPPGAGVAHTGQALLLGERHRRVPAAARVDVRAGDQHRVARLLQQSRERPRSATGSGIARPVTARASALAAMILVGLRAPVVHRDRHERRAARRQRGVVDRARERVRHVLGARRLVRPLHVRLRSDDRVAVGEVGLHRDLRAHLLAGRDQQRRLVRLRVGDAAHRVAHAGGGVEVDVRRACRSPGRSRRPSPRRPAPAGRGRR